MSNFTLAAFKEHRIANKIQVVRDAREAMDYLRRGDFSERNCNPALVLLDLKMPCMDGLEARPDQVG